MGDGRKRAKKGRKANQPKSRRGAGGQTIEPPLSGAGGHAGEPPFPGAVLVETHAHTAEISMCSELSAAKLTALVAAHGYAALVITDHYLSGKTDTDAGRAAFAGGYERAREAGLRLGLAVLPGMELRFASEGYNDFLVYLPDPALYHTLKGLCAMEPSAFRRLADAEGLLVYQAHPYRLGQRPMPPGCLHGVEVHNGNPNHNSRNADARAYAEAHGLAMIAGSDLHEPVGAGRGGVWAPPEAVATPQAFVAYLRANPRPALFCPKKAR
jgi:predicted metal-dependent phosphoesterase TrpH